MAETNANEILGGENKDDVNKMLDENLPESAAPENNMGVGDPPQGEHQQSETQKQGQTDNLPPWDIDDSDAIVQNTPDNIREIPATELAAPEQESENITPPSDIPAPDIADAVKVDDVSADEKKLAEQEAEKDVPPKQEGNGRSRKTDEPAKDPKTEKPGKTDKKPPDKPKRGNGGKPAKEGKKSAAVGGGGQSGQSADKTDTPPAPAASENAAPVPEPPRDATRPGEAETIVYIDHAELHPFKNHPFQVRDDDAMKTLVASVKERGVDQPAIVRPREGGGYEMIAGHRRQQASEMAGLKNIPCVVRNMTDDEAVLAMTESNFNQRAEILPSERAQALKMQLDAIKRQGARFNGVASGDVGKRSNEIVADRNKMAVKQVQRYIALNKLTPDMMKLVDEKKVPFTAAVEISYIKPKNQDYIAMTIDTLQSAPSLAQAQRMRELDQKNILNSDVIDGIVLEEKKEETRVILNSQELSKYFGAEKSPKEMKEQILKLLDEYKAKQPPELAKPEKKTEKEKEK